MRQQVDTINERIREALGERHDLVLEIARWKAAHGGVRVDPVREAEMMTRLLARHDGRPPIDGLMRIFGPIFEEGRRTLLGEAPAPIAAEPEPGFRVRGHAFGGRPQLIAGPLLVEGADAIDAVARELQRLRIPFLRGGVYPPAGIQACRGEAGLRILRDAADHHDLAVVTEVADPRDAELVARYADILQVGNRNMYHRELLRAVAATGKPVLLKRAILATLDEFLAAAEELAQAGAKHVVLCERGGKLPGGRAWLDLESVPWLRLRSPWPVAVDVSHASSGGTVLEPLARASLAAGAHAVMVLVHPNPGQAAGEGGIVLPLADLGGFVRGVGIAEG